MKLHTKTRRLQLNVSRWIQRHPKKTALAVALLSLMVVGGVVAAFMMQPRKPAPVVAKPKPIAKKIDPVYYSPLTGVKTSQASTMRPVTPVMIENSPDARPQSGIKDAGIVYEAIAEGGITRFLTLHQENTPALVGPVRSLRMYYLDWAAAYDGCIMHIGGSAAALAEVRNGQYCDGDQFFNSQYYWRAADRYAPHNVYTSFEKLDQLNAAKGKSSSKFVGFARTDGKPAATPNATSVEINFSSALYNTHYDFDAASNSYLRSVGGEPSNDREAGRVSPSVVVAMRVEMTKVMEDGWRESIATIGSGQATIFQNGVATEATWHKDSRTAPLRLTDAAGVDIKLIRGQTWVAAVPGTGSVSWQ